MDKRTHRIALPGEDEALRLEKQTHKDRRPSGGQRRVWKERHLDKLLAEIRKTPPDLLHI